MDPKGLEPLLLPSVADPLEADVRVLACELVTSRPLIPGPNYSLSECEDCSRPVWLGPNHRQLIVEFEHLDADYTILCEMCILRLVNGNDEIEIGSASIAADRLSLLRGAIPRQPIVAIQRADLPLIRSANPGLTFRPLR